MSPAKSEKKVTPDLSADKLTASSTPVWVTILSTTAAIRGESWGNGVIGISLQSGAGILGQSSSGDGVRGQTQGAGMSGVAGIHTNGGNGIYGQSNGNAGCFDGHVQVNGDLTVSGDVFLPLVVSSGGDCAEQFDVAAGEELLPGTVVVMSQHGCLEPARAAYDQRAVGIVAGAGSYSPGILLDANRTPAARRAAISLAGKAYCLADAAYGPINVGDLLTTSETAGHAMRAADRTRAFASVIGKSMGSLKQGKGLIPVLVTLQ